MPKKGKKGKGKKAKAAPLPKRPPPKPCGTSRSIARLDHHEMAVTSIAVSQESRCFFTAGLDGCVAMLDAGTEVLHWYDNVQSEILCLAKLGPLLFSGTATGESVRESEQAGERVNMPTGCDL